MSQIDIQTLFPLWRRVSVDLAQDFINVNFKAIVTCVDSTALDNVFIGRLIDERFLAGLLANVDPNGENGEFHSFVFEGPLSKEGIPLTIRRSGAERVLLLLRFVTYVTSYEPKMKLRSSCNATIFF